MSKYNVERFLKAQEKDYQTALSELKRGRKTSHWIWYVFPQLKFLGRSDTAIFYGIANAEEGREYCENEVLHGQYIECCLALDGVKETNPTLVMGSSVDAKKLCSSLTLFYVLDGENKSLYKRLIDKFYGGSFDDLTLQRLKEDGETVNF